jgi:hypothetical protein
MFGPPTQLGTGDAPRTQNRGRTMAEPHVTLARDSLNPVEEKLRGPLQDQLTSALRAATEKTQHTYAGESVDEVVATLLSRTRAGLHPDIAAGFHPDPAQLRQVAESIVAAANTHDLHNLRTGSISQAE